MKVFIGCEKPGLLKVDSKKSIEIVRYHAPHAHAAAGCEIAIVFAGKFFDADILMEDRRELAIREAVQFAWRLRERDVRIVTIISPIAIPVLDIRLAFQKDYVSEHRHFTSRAKKDEDLARPDTVQWAHVWNAFDYLKPESQRHLFFFHDEQNYPADQLPWEYYLETVKIEAEKARDVSAVRPKEND